MLFLLFGHRRRCHSMHHSFFYRSIRDLSSRRGKVVSSAAAALRDHMFPGAAISVGGFGLSGLPETLLDEIALLDEAKDLKIIHLTASVDGYGVGKLIECNKVKRLCSSYVGENKHLEKMYFGGQIEVELIPQGSLAARLRAAGAGTPAFYTPTGTGTLYANGGIPIKFASDGSGRVEIQSQPRETRTFNGREYILEEAIHTDISLVKAWKADTRGNLVFRGTSRNSNPDVAMSGKITIAEAEEIVEAGSIHPDEIHLPGIYVDRLILATRNEKRIERSKEIESNGRTVAHHEKRERIMRRVAKEFKDGMYVNLGIGIPTMASNYVPNQVIIELQSENGLLGIGPYPDRNMGQKPDADWINAGKETITAVDGGSTFSSSSSFDMIRGGNLDLTILGALQVSACGDLASWIVPGKIFKGMGGSMDLVSAPRAKVVVAMDHVAKDGKSKILSECTLPLTGKRVVNRIITDMAVFDCDKEGDGGLTLMEIAPGITVDDVAKATGCVYKTADNLSVMDFN